MSNAIDVREDHNGGYASDKPFIVYVNGKLLSTKAYNPRRFKTSIAAAIAGAKHVDELRERGAK